MKSKILIICTGNTCRSQMAEYILKSFDPELDVLSAGTEPGKIINPRTVKVMAEIGIDVSNSKPRKVNCFLNSSFDYVVTVCDDAREICPAFLGIVKSRLHIGFEDPAMATGTEDEVMKKYREIRDQIKLKFLTSTNTLKPTPMTENHQYLLSRCQKYCSYQERSIFEVKRKLYEWKSQPKVAEKIIIQLIDDNYLNEERFAKSFSIGKFRHKKWGKNKIIYELKKKQIPELIIQIGLAEIDDDEYLQTLKELIKKKFDEVKEANPLKKKYKVATYAVNKGFHSGFVWDVIGAELT